MDIREYARFDAVGLADLVRTGQVSAGELHAAALAACKLVNTQLNAVVETYPPPDQNHSPDDRPFTGVPFMLKDTGCTERGRRCESGSRLLRGATATADTELMRRFRSAGLVNLGRTATSELAITATVETAVNGATRNPWDPERSPAGSSGGAAAAVAAGIVPVAHATDGGGSIRMPASACGVVGLKPSRGRITQAPRRHLLGDLNVEFALTRTVRDAAALLDAVSGSVAGDPYFIPPPAESFTTQLRRPQPPLRVAINTTHSGPGRVDTDVAHATAMVGDVLTNLGHYVEETSLRIPLEEYLDAVTCVWCVENMAAVHAAEALTGRVGDEHTLEGLTLARIRWGQTQTADDVLNALTTLDQTRRQLGRVFTGYDVIVSPTLPTLPILLGNYDPEAEVAHDWYYASPVGYLEYMTSLFNCGGQPALSLPLAQTRAGLPIGIQFASQLGAEATLLRLASSLEQTMPWHKRTPRIHVSK